MSTEQDTPLPCPFCGHVGLHFEDGSTFRWGLASCGACGATCGEVRRSYPDDGKWHADAIREWNTRAGPSPKATHGEWQPIETAPKDGRDLLLWESGSSVPVVAGWRDGRRPGWHASQEHYNTDGDACVVDTLWQDGITHWMPIPAAPAATKEPQP